MLVGLLKFKRQLDLGRLETLRMNGVVPLCMNQCRSLFLNYVALLP